MDEHDNRTGIAGYGGRTPSCRRTGGDLHGTRRRRTLFVIDCCRDAPSASTEAGLDFCRLEAVFLTHLHADHVGDLPGMLLYGWGARVRDNWPLAPIRVYGPSRPKTLPAGDAMFHRQTTIHPERPAPAPRT